MEAFKTNIYNIYNLINDDKHESTLVNTKIISKQYLAYYIYRIVTKFMYLVEQSSTTEDINFFFSLLRIPKEHNRYLNYPIAGKLTNEIEILDMCILGGIQMFEKIDNYLKTLNNKNKQNKYKAFYTFIAEKSVAVIIKDIMDLQKLLPGLSVAIIRPNYLDDTQL
jgi:hypothetical protein